MQAQLLVVGDDSLIELSRSMVADEEGFALLVAHSYAEARKQLGQQHPAVILIAQMLPDGSGLALLRTLQQERCPAVPLLVLDAPEGDASGLEALRTGAFACLSMPINADLLHLMLVRANDYACLLQAERERERLRLQQEAMRAAAHHISQHLTVIMGETQLLQEENLDLEVRAGLARILRATEYAAYELGTLRASQHRIMQTDLSRV